MNDCYRKKLTCEAAEKKVSEYQGGIEMVKCGSHYHLAPCPKVKK